MLVGEQSGDREGLSGEPFVGPAGVVLDRALDAAGVPRDDAYGGAPIPRNSAVRDRDTPGLRPGFARSPDPT